MGLCRQEELLAIFYFMKQLSIFVDESGTYSTPEDINSYYLVGLVFHNQDICINQEIIRFDKTMRDSGFNFDYFHASPIVRSKEVFENYSLDDRRKLFYKMLNFFNHCPIKYEVLKIKRKEASDSVSLSVKIAKLIKLFIENNKSYFDSFDKMIVYYDYGQFGLGSVLGTTLSLLLRNIEFRKAEQSRYRLLQVADFVCYLELIRIKYQENRLSTIEKKFFYKPQELQKVFLKSLNKKKL